MGRSSREAFLLARVSIITSNGAANAKAAFYIAAMNSGNRAGADNKGGKRKMNEFNRARRLFRLQCFINDVTALFNEKAAGKHPGGRLKKIKAYNLSFAATKKADPELVTLVETCERLRIELTDGKPYDQRKSDEIDRLFAQFSEEVERRRLS